MSQKLEVTVKIIATQETPSVAPAFAITGDLDINGKTVPFALGRAEDLYSAIGTAVEVLASIPETLQVLEEALGAAQADA